jgi:hypothetical protein
MTDWEGASTDGKSKAGAGVACMALPVEMGTEKDGGMTVAEVSFSGVEAASSRRGGRTMRATSAILVRRREKVMPGGCTTVGAGWSWVPHRLIEGRWDGAGDPGAAASFATESMEMDGGGATGLTFPCPIIGGGKGAGGGKSRLTRRIPPERVMVRNVSASAMSLATVTSPEENSTGAGGILTRVTGRREGSGPGAGSGVVATGEAIGAGAGAASAAASGASGVGVGAGGDVAGSVFSASLVGLALKKMSGQRMEIQIRRRLGKHEGIWASCSF